MLFLFDHDISPYLPGAAKYKVLKFRLKQTARDKQGLNRLPTLFEKLNIMMPVNGVTQIAEINSHDPRRWLTTMALIYGEKLSDVLINKWANRLNAEQLGHYDFRSAETKAAASAITRTRGTDRTLERTEILPQAGRPAWAQDRYCDHP